MANLAIKGHPTRGKEVIEILEMLGGKNRYKLDGKKDLWYILSNSTIEYATYSFQERCYSIYEFEACFPYKVGDKVISQYGKLGRIRSLIWSERDNQVRYELEDDVDSLYFANELQPVEEKETMEGKGTLVQIDLTRELCIADKVEVILGDYEFVLKDGKTYFVKKKPQYPKNYEECCKTLGYSGNYNMILTTDVDNKLFNALYRLKVCRDAYWKIAGEQMGLGKPWKPDWNNVSDKHCIYFVSGEIWLTECQTRQCTLAFPTAEMRDEFYTNFKDLIESCKELL